MNSGIYQITHKDSGRSYIGQSTNLRHRKAQYKCSGGSGNGNSVIKRAILKYGWDAFDYKVLVYADKYDYLNDIEIKLIDAFNSKVPNGFNVDVGGLNRALSESTKKLLSIRHTGKKLSEETKKKLSITSKAYWENAPQEVLDINKEKARNINLGKKFTEEHRLNLSKARKALFASGELVHHKPNLGRIFSEETRSKMREAHLKRWAKIKG